MYGILTVIILTKNEELNIIDKVIDDLVSMSKHEEFHKNNM